MKSEMVEELQTRIVQALSNSAQTVFTQTQLVNIFEEIKSEMEQVKSWSFIRLIKFALETLPLREIRLEFTHHSYLRFLWGTTDLFELAQSLTSKGYLSHGTAMAVHRLIESEPDVFYVNEEQTPKPSSSGKLQQASIDKAFKKDGRRISQNKAEFEEHTFCILNGKHTRNLGVIDHTRPNGVVVSVTSIERTLVDAVVRPFYAGGVNGILTAYRLAGSRANAEQMALILSSLKLVYPYHQSIGFYMSRSGSFAPDAIEVFARMSKDFDFYLEYQMDNPAYSKEWRIYYPKELDIR